jgi:hypothetical protein
MLNRSHRPAAARSNGSGAGVVRQWASRIASTKPPSWRTESRATPVSQPTTSTAIHGKGAATSGRTPGAPTVAAAIVSRSIRIAGPAVSHRELRTNSVTAGAAANSASAPQKRA